jgi:predicted ATPase
VAAPAPGPAGRAGAPPAAGREESFAAWKRFLELVAATGPAVFVFEDLHWADQAMLAFLEHLAATSTGVPMLLVCSTRPELYDRHHAWAATGRNVTRIDLAPLSAEDTAELVSSMFGEAVPDAEVQHSILERAGGNPLFAEELVRMLKEQELVVTRDRAVALADGAEVWSRPDSLRARRSVSSGPRRPGRRGGSPTPSGRWRRRSTGSRPKGIA